MRAELRGLLVELEGRPPPAGLGLVPSEPVRPSLADRARLWDLTIRLGRELGAAIDAEPAPGAGPAPRSRRKRVDYG